MMEHILMFMIFLPFFGGFLLVCNLQGSIYNSEIALLFSSFTFMVSLLIWVLFDNSSLMFQFNDGFWWLPESSFYFYLGIDGISVFFILLTTFLFPLCILSSWDLVFFKKFLGQKEFLILFLFMEGFILFVFCVLDLFLFYIFFEAVLIPMFLILGIWGSSESKVRAGYFFFLYTLFGSLFMLFGILFIFFEVGSTDFIILSNHFFSFDEQKILWVAFFISFAVKVPMVPFHIWLPEAHVEAPTAGSVLLAGILLKLGSYGMMSFLLCLFPLGSLFFTPFLYSVALVGVVYTSLTAVRQSDMKRVIAYASVAHMNTTLVGLFSFTLVGIEGALLQMLSHGIVSGALFLCVGVLYDRYHTSLIKYYGGLVYTMPCFISIFLFFTMANIALPGTSSFVGEFMIFLGIFSYNKVCAFFVAFGMVLGGVYSLWLFNSISYNNYKTQYIGFSQDLTRREFMMFMPLVFVTLWMGLFPEFFLNSMHSSCGHLVSFVNCS